jgi:hypothetical protein
VRWGRDGRFVRDLSSPVRGVAPEGRRSPVSARFRKALEGLDYRNWQLFEEVAAQFMADEFPRLRTLADPSGDGGRDGILHSEDYPTVAIQYSVTPETSAKIRSTAKTLNDGHPEITNLIYVTPRDVPTAVRDAETVQLRNQNRMNLDIRDVTWFVDREDRSSSTHAAAEMAAVRIVDPLLASAGLRDSFRPELSTEDTRAALLFLSMQREDDDRNRGLTKLCFDALVRATLRGTDNDNRMTLGQVHEAVARLVPSHSKGDVVEYTDRALDRLERGAVRHWTIDGTYCLSFDERKRLIEEIVQLEDLESAFNSQLRSSLEFVAEGLGASANDVENDHLARARRVIETYLFEQGESFVAALAGGQSPLFIEQDLHSVVQEDAGSHPDTTSLRDSIVPLTEEAIRRTILDPSHATIAFLHSAKEAYTLFAFLKESPNVQAAVTKIFEGGELWLDTTVVLPLLAEHLLDPNERQYSRLFEASRAAGVKLFVTPGVVEEINSHFVRCRAAIRLGPQFRGRSPFLLNAFVWSGGDIRRFGEFEAEFRGESRPETDISDYLRQELAISTRSLADEVDRAPDELRWPVQEYWRKAHANRRSGQDSIDPVLIERLAQHDIESFLGVVQRRGGELVGNPLGYTTWWLTVDRHAVDAATTISSQNDIRGLDTPVIGLAFLTYYLMVGDARRQLTSEQARQLPAILDPTLMDVAPKELLAAAEKVRQAIDGSSVRRMRRDIRDLLESDRIRSGKLGRVGIDSIQYDIEMALKS